MIVTTWEEVRNELHLDSDDEQAIEFEKELIRTMIQIREQQGLTQAKMAELCKMKQPMIARMEKAVHSPRIDSLLKALVPLGYTLQIVPIKKEK